MARLRPLGDYLVIRRDPPPPAVQNGILVLHDADRNNRVETGVVVRVGPGVALPTGGRAPVDVAAGARVAFWSANHATRGGDQLLAAVDALEDGTCLLRARDILYVVDDGPLSSPNAL